MLAVFDSLSTLVHVARIERIQEKFVKYALHRLGWDTSRDLPPYTSRCMLLSLDTLKTRRDIAKILFVYDILSVSSPPLLTEVGFRVPSYPTRRHEFFHIENHRTNYGAFEPLNAALHSFNEIANLFDFNKSRSQFVAQVKA
jgi:hypothetical protein